MDNNKFQNNLLIIKEKLNEIRQDDKNFNDIYFDFERICGKDLATSKFVNKYFTNDISLEKILRQRKDDDIILYSDKSKQYILLPEYNDYNNFINYTLNFEGEYYQIILNNEKQKLIFCYNSTEKVEQIEQISNTILINKIEEYYKTKPIISYNNYYRCYQVVINNVQLLNYKENIDYLEKLHDYINDKNLSKNIRIMDSIKIDDNIRYIQPHISIEWKNDRQI